MSRDPWYDTWTRAYIDLHVAYLAVLRLRHHRRKDDPEVIRKDMGSLDPFNGIGSECAPQAVEAWYALWEKHAHEEETRRVMGAAAEAIKNHWDSWSAFNKIVPLHIQSTRPALSFDTYMTATAGVRDAMQDRAEVLAKTYEEHLKSKG